MLKVITIDDKTTVKNILNVVRKKPPDFQRIFFYHITLNDKTLEVFSLLVDQDKDEVLLSQCRNKVANTNTLLTLSNRP